MPWGFTGQETLQAGQVTGNRNGGRDSGALGSAVPAALLGSVVLLLLCYREDVDLNSDRFQWVWESLHPPSLVHWASYFFIPAFTWNIESISDFRISLYFHLILKLFLIVFPKFPENSLAPFSSFFPNHSNFRDETLHLTVIVQPNIWPGLNL